MPDQQPSQGDQKRSTKQYLREFLRPAYHIKRFIEDLKAARHALQNRRIESLLDDRKSLAEAFRGRLFATYLLSGVFGALGPLTGLVTQYVTESPYLGFFVGLLLANLFATIAFQAIWALAHQRIYACETRKWSRWIVNLERDILPIQWDGFRLALLVIIVTAPVMVGAIWLIESANEEAAKVIPFPIIGPMIEMVVIHSSLVRIMGDLFERHSWRMADRHKTSD
jgi:hypothetical protein